MMLIILTSLKSKYNQTMCVFKFQSAHFTFNHHLSYIFIYIHYHLSYIYTCNYLYYNDIFYFNQNK